MPKTGKSQKAMSVTKKAAFAATPVADDPSPPAEKPAPAEDLPAEDVAAEESTEESVNLSALSGDTEEVRHHSSSDGGTREIPVANKANKYRISHKYIPDYDFTDEMVATLIDFIRANPCLYDKKDGSYSNTRKKKDLWVKCAELFPNCHFLECRKYFEKKRTAFGKLEAFEMKSGSAARGRTAKEEEHTKDWGFLLGHIAHAITMSSHNLKKDSQQQDPLASGT